MHIIDSNCNFFVIIEVVPHRNGEGHKTRFKNNKIFNVLCTKVKEDKNWKLLIKMAYVWRKKIGWENNC